MSITLWKPEPNVVLHQALGKAGEEAAELSKELLRCIIQGFEASDPKTGTRNIDNLADEIADMYAALQWLQEVGQIEPDEIRMDTKLRGFRRWQKMLEQDMAGPSSEPNVGTMLDRTLAAENETIGFRAALGKISTYVAPKRLQGKAFHTLRDIARAALAATTEGSADA